MGASLIAIGDSIIRGRTKHQGGLPARSWAAWLSRSERMLHTERAVGGAASEAVIAEQLPVLGSARWDVACLSVGANDVLADWDPEVYERNLTTIVEALSSAANVVLLTNLPDRFRQLPGWRGQYAPRVASANAITASVAASLGAHLVDVSDLGGRNLLGADLVHPTALGSLRYAQRAAGSLGVREPTHDQAAASVGAVGYSWEAGPDRRAPSS